jgi:hypothetical protein
MPIEQLSDIQFDEIAFEKLVLPPIKKRMISAFVRNAGGAFTGYLPPPPPPLYPPFLHSLSSPSSLSFCETRENY